MKKNISKVDDLTKKIIYAFTRYSLEQCNEPDEKRTVAKELSLTKPTVTNRYKYGNWSFEEVKASARITKDDELKVYLKQQF